MISSFMWVNNDNSITILYVHCKCFQISHIINDAFFLFMCSLYDSVLLKTATVTSFIPIAEINYFFMFKKRNDVNFCHLQRNGLNWDVKWETECFLTTYSQWHGTHSLLCHGACPQEIILKRAADLAEALYSMPRNNQLALGAGRSPPPAAPFNAYGAPDAQWTDGECALPLPAGALPSPQAAR